VSVPRFFIMSSFFSDKAAISSLDCSLETRSDHQIGQQTFWNNCTMAEKLFEEEESKAYGMPKIPTQIIFVVLSGFENTAMPWISQWFFWRAAETMRRIDLFLNGLSAEMGTRVYCAKVIEVFVAPTQIIVLLAFDLRRTRPC